MEYTARRTESTCDKCGASLTGMNYTTCNKCIRAEQSKKRSLGEVVEQCNLHNLSPVAYILANLNAYTYDKANKEKLKKREAKRRRRKAKKRRNKK